MVNRKNVDKEGNVMLGVRLIQASEYQKPTLTYILYSLPLRTGQQPLYYPQGSKHTLLMPPPGSALSGGPIPDRGCHQAIVGSLCGSQV